MLLFWMADINVSVSLAQFAQWITFWTNSQVSLMRQTLNMVLNVKMLQIEFGLM